MEWYKKLIGKEIASAEYISAEFGRTYSHYLCLVFADKTKTIIAGGEPYEPDPSIEEMKKAPRYFSAKEIAEAVERKENKRRAAIERQEALERSEYEILKRKYGVE